MAGGECEIRVRLAEHHGKEGPAGRRQGMGRSRGQVREAFLRGPWRRGLRLPISGAMCLNQPSPALTVNPIDSATLILPDFYAMVLKSMQSSAPCRLARFF